MEKPNYEDIIENTVEAMVAVSLDLSLTVFNQGAEKMTELSREKALGRPVKEVFGADPWLSDLLSETVESGKLLSGYEEELKRRYSAPLPVAVTTNAVYDADGALIGAVALIKDLTGVKAVEAESLRKERLSYIGTFASSLAHELKNPLSGIRGAAQLLGRKIEDKELGEFAEVIISETDRLNSMLKEMLDFTRPRALAKEELNIHKVLDKVLILLGDEEKKRIAREYDPSLPHVIADEAQITQVFLNLAKNAVEAAGSEGKIRIVTRMLTDFHLEMDGIEGDKFAAIEVIDNGPGITKDDIEKIFNPFYTTKPGGSGLGMGISFRIVKEHGGFLKVKSTPGSGTSVGVYLAIAEKKEERA